jgi:hypothetical protein
MALGPVARTWDPRVRFAGTYDDNWRDNIYPFLPADFDERFFQAAPADQQIPYCRGGEAVRCINLTPNGRLEFVIPRLTAPVVYRFQQGDVRIEPNLDMVVIEPDLNRVLLTWRSAIPLKRKMHALREVSVGHGAERSLLWSQSRECGGVHCGDGNGVSGRAQRDVGMRRLAGRDLGVPRTPVL